MLHAVLMSEFHDSPVGNRLFIVERESSMQQSLAMGALCRVFEL